MKNLLLFLCLFALSCTASKEVISEDLLQHEETVQIPGKSKDDLYLQVNTWFVESFESAESVIEFSDKEAGRVVGKYVFTYGESRVRSIIQVDVKEGVYKISFKNPLTQHVGQDIDYRMIRTNKSLQMVNDKWRLLALDLKKYLQKESRW